MLENYLYDDDRREFLNYFIQGQKSPIVRLFNGVAREGFVTPKDIVREVASKTEKSDGYKEALNNVLWEYPQDALNYAEWTLVYVNAPKEDQEEYQRIVKENLHIHKNNKKVPPSEPQLNLLFKLGYAGLEPTTKEEASQAIDYCLTKQYWKEFKMQEIPSCDASGEDIYLRLLRIGIFMGRLSAMLKPNVFESITDMHDDNGVLVITYKDKESITQIIRELIKKSWSSFCQPSCVDIKFINKERAMV